MYWILGNKKSRLILVLKTNRLPLKFQKINQRNLILIFLLFQYNCCEFILFANQLFGIYPKQKTINRIIIIRCSHYRQIFYHLPPFLIESDQNHFDTIYPALHDISQIRLTHAALLFGQK